MSSNSDTGQKPTDGMHSQFNSTDNDGRSFDMLSGDREGSGDLSNWTETKRSVPTGGDWEQVTTVFYENPIADYKMEVRAIPRDSAGRTVEYHIKVEQMADGTDDDVFRIFPKRIRPEPLWKGTKRGLTDDIDGLVKEIQLRFSSGEGDNNNQECPHIPLGPSAVDGETNQWNLPNGPEANGTLDHWEHTDFVNDEDRNGDLPSHVPHHCFDNKASNYRIDLWNPNTNNTEEDEQTWDASVTHYEIDESTRTTVFTTTLWSSEVTVRGDIESATEDLRLEYSDHTVDSPEEPAVSWSNSRW